MSGNQQAAFVEARRVLDEADPASPSARMLAREVLRLHEPDETLVERVARSVAVHDWPDDQGVWAAFEEYVRENYRASARAALAALRATS